LVSLTGNSEDDDAMDYFGRKKKQNPIGKFMCMFYREIIARLT